MRSLPVKPLAAALLANLLFAVPAPAVILKLVPLKEVLDREQHIFVASVEAVAPEKPAVVFKVEDKLKGETVPFEKMVVNLTGDAEAKKDKHTQVMLDRLEAGRKLIVFTSREEETYYAFCFMEGTWFQMKGTVDKESKAVRWAFLHCEPYLRRTFKGTTAELQKVVTDGLAKKAEPPAPDKEEKPGFGPPLKKECGDDVNSEPQASAAWAPRSALLGVIPSFALIGPMAIIAALFPGVAARMAVGMKKWRAFLVVASANSTLAIVYFFTREYLPDVPAFNLTSFTLYLMGLTAVGLVWAGRRYRRLAADDPTVTATPSRTELLALFGLTAFAGLLAASVRFFGPWSAAVELPMREFTFIAAGLLAATVYASYRTFTPAVDNSEHPIRLSVSGESVGLGTLFLCGLVTVLLARGGDAHTATPGGLHGDGGHDPAQAKVKLTDTKVFEIAGADQVMSGVTIDGDALYFGTSSQTSFRTSGQVFCVDRHTGAVRWKYKPDDSKPVFCTPIVSNGRVFVGEGLHTDNGCRLFCLDAASGKPAWDNPFQTTSHTEGTPSVIDGKVYFSAGDDGLICADAKTGAEVWHLPGEANKLHIDTPPTVVGNRVFAGSGYSTYALLCVDATSGKELWRTPVPMRSFGPALADAERVIYGLGTGNLTLDTEGGEREPAGAVVCVDAASGKQIWKYDLTRSVHTSLAADGLFVYAASRDGYLHCLNRRTGKLRWKLGISGTPLTAGPAAAADADGVPVAVYAVTAEGLVVCVNPYTGKTYWARDMREQTGKLVEEVYSTPVVAADGKTRTVYVGAMVKNRNNGAKTAAVFRFDDEIE